MKRVLLYSIGVLLGGLLVWKMPFVKRSEKVMQPTTTFHTTGIHEALVQERGWLNTSRPLVADDLAGRIILADFWTFCCINCIHIMPDLKKLEAEFGEDLTVIGVHSGKFFNERDIDTIRDAVLRHDLEHPVVNDAGFQVWKTFGARAWPTLILINPEGRVERVYSGEGHLEALRRDIAALTKEYAGRFNRSPLPIELEEGKQRMSLLNFPGKLAFAPDLELLFIADTNNNRILAAKLTGEVTMVIGGTERGWKDGNFETARFNWPQGVLYRDQKLYVADTENHLLREIDLQKKRVTTLATSLSSPWDLAFDPDGNEIMIAMAGTHQLWGYHLQNKELRVIAGNGIESIDDGLSPLNSLSQPSGLASIGNKLYFVDSETSSLRVLEEGRITTLVGTALFDFGFQDGIGKKAQLQHPLGLDADETGIYIADAYNHALRRYDPKTQELTTLSGKGSAGYFDGSTSDALFNEPNDLLKIGDIIYVADTNNHLIRVIDLKQKTTRSLPIHFERQAREGPETDLPRLMRATPITLSSEKPITVQLHFQSGWKLNDDAPSWIALFEGERQVVFRVERDDLKGGTVNLPPLEAGKTYRLQGTFYFCEARDAKTCLISSYDQLLKPQKKGKSGVVEIHLSPEG